MFCSLCSPRVRFVFVVVTAGVVGCAADTDIAKVSKPVQTKGNRSAQGAKAGQDRVELEFKAIENLAVSIEVPTDARIVQRAGGRVTVFNDALNFEVSPVGSAHAASFAAMKHKIEQDPNAFKSFTKEEQFKGGWRLEFELSRMTDAAQSLYGVNVRKTLAGTQYSCSRNVGQEGKRDAIARACMSLKADPSGAGAGE